MITSTLLTLFVLPAISHLLLRGRAAKHAAGDHDDASGDRGFVASGEGAAPA